MADPNLLPPGQLNTGVPALTTITAPFPTVAVEARFYVCSVQSASLHRQDGKKIPFVHGIAKIEIKADMDYIEQEIANGNSFLRAATIDEINMYNMRVDPNGTIASNLRPALEAEIRSTLEAQILKQLAERGIDTTGITFAETPAPVVEDKKDDITKIAETGARLTASQQLALLRSNSGNGATIKPVSTADLAGAAKQSGV